jgi:hypothetical protein
MPKNVAVTVAQIGARCWLLSTTAGSVFIARFWKILNIELVGNVLHRRRDHILATRPFAEVNQTAALAAERKVLRFPSDGLLAGGAFQIGLALARHGLIVDGSVKVH